MINLEQHDARIEDLVKYASSKGLLHNVVGFSSDATKPETFLRIHYKNRKSRVLYWRAIKDIEERSRT